MKALQMILILALSGCYDDMRVDINCEYQGAIIMTECRQIGIDYHYTIKYKGEIISVSTYEIYAGYRMGDTINKPCLGEELTLTNEK